MKILLFAPGFQIHAALPLVCLSDPNISFLGRTQTDRFATGSRFVTRGSCLAATLVVSVSYCPMMPQRGMLTTEIIRRIQKSDIMTMIVVSGVVVQGKKIRAEVAVEVAPDGMDVIGVVLRAVVFDGGISPIT